MSLHCMTDLETFGTSKRAVIIQLSAVKFTDNFEITDHFNHLIDPQSCLDAGLDIDLNTVMWWMEQSEEAKKSVILNRKRSPLKEALESFRWWLPKDTKVWGNGASFDLSILDSAYRACHREKPWKHWDERCYRTMNALISKDDPSRPAFQGVKHNAIDDCIHQIKQLEHVCKRLNIALA